MTTAEYLHQQLAPLIGAKLVAVREGEQTAERAQLGYDQGELLLVVELGNGNEQYIGIWSDEEGNDNGWLSLPEGE